jgi:hypothetical protein
MRFLWSGVVVIDWRIVAKLGMKMLEKVLLKKLLFFLQRLSFNSFQLFKPKLFTFKIVERLE